MKYLFARFGGIEKLLKDKFILLFLDCDGTLAPIARTPAEASVSQETRELLHRLSGKTYCRLGIISGRSLEDIKKVVGIEGIIYAGNHGLEMEGPSIKFKSQVSPHLKASIRGVAEDIKERLKGIKGVLVEDKGLTLSIHYRLVDAGDIPAFAKIISDTTRPYMKRGEIKLSRGKKVYEIKPPVPWNKGKAVLWFLARQQFSAGEETVLPVYIGDDTTDEDAFKAIKKKGLAIFVGRPRNSEADYYLKDTREVTRFLRLIAEIKS